MAEVESSLERINPITYDTMLRLSELLTTRGEVALIYEAGKWSILQDIQDNE